MLPADYKARKEFPLMTVLAAYFPDAIEALVDLCKQGNIQHTVDANAVNPFKLPGDTITWDRSKSMDQMNTLMRHAWDHERAKRSRDAHSVHDTDGVLHIVKVLWRAAAEAQLTIEALRTTGQCIPVVRSTGTVIPAGGTPEQRFVDGGGLVPAGTKLPSGAIAGMAAEMLQAGQINRVEAVAAQTPGRVDSKAHLPDCRCPGCYARRHNPEPI